MKHTFQTTSEVTSVKQVSKYKYTYIYFKLMLDID